MKYLPEILFCGNKTALRDLRLTFSTIQKHNKCTRGPENLFSSTIVFFFIYSSSSCATVPRIVHQPPASLTHTCNLVKLQSQADKKTNKKNPMKTSRRSLNIKAPDTAGVERPSRLDSSSLLPYFHQLVHGSSAAAPH